MKVYESHSPDLPHKAVRFSALRRTLGFALPPKGEDTPLAKATKDLILALGKLDEGAAGARRAKLDRNEFAQMIYPVRKATTDAAAAVLALANAQKTAANSKRNGLLAPPGLAMTDAVGAHMDAEIRATVAHMKGPPRERLLNAIAAGGEVRVRDALLRGAFASTEADVAKAAYAAARKAAARGDFDDCDKMEKEAEWATGIAGSATNIANESISAITFELVKAA